MCERLPDCYAAAHLMPVRCVLAKLSPHFSSLPFATFVSEPSLHSPSFRAPQNCRWLEQRQHYFHGPRLERGAANERVWSAMIYGIVIAKRECRSRRHCRVNILCPRGRSLPIPKRYDGKLVDTRKCSNHAQNRVDFSSDNGNMFRPGEHELI